MKILYNIVSSKYLNNYIFLLWILHVIVSFIYTRSLPWGGDEWYTYNDYTLTGCFNNILVLAAKKIIGPLTSTNYIIYRQIGLVWVSLLYIFIYYTIKSNKLTPKNSVLVFCFLVTVSFSSFFIFQEQMFRYYSLYVFYSTVVNVFILYSFGKYTELRKWMIFLILISIGVHITITIQLLFYVVLCEFRILGVKKTIIAFTFLISGLIFYLLNFDSIMPIINKVFTFGNYSVGNSELMGFKLSMLAKPIISVFHYFFGYDLVPTENYIVSVLFLILLIFLGFSIFSYMKIHGAEKLIKIFCVSLFPMLFMFVVIQSLSTPGMTNFESKHTLFSFFWIFFFIFHFITVIKSKFSKYLSIFTFALTIVSGLLASVIYPKEDWFQVGSAMRDYSGVERAIISDGYSMQNVKLFSNNVKCQIVSNDDSLEIVNILRRCKVVQYVTSDYKSYEILEKEQMWNTGTDSRNRHYMLYRTINMLSQQGFVLNKGYSNYPLMSYVFTKKNSKIDRENNLLSYVGFEYADLDLPIVLRGAKSQIIGWRKYETGDTFEVKESFYYLCAAKFGRDTLGFDIRNGRFLLFPNMDNSDEYQKSFNRILNIGDSVIVCETKRPLLSSSITYNGSFLPSTLCLYKNLSLANSKITITQPNVRIFVGILN
jgi:hypothetical protein